MRAQKTAPQGLNAAAQCSLLFPLCARRAFVWGCWHVQSPRRREQASQQQHVQRSGTALHIPEQAAQCPLLWRPPCVTGPALHPGDGHEGGVGRHTLGTRGFSAVLVLGDPPAACSDGDQPLEALSIHQKPDAAPVVTPELCRAPGWSRRCHQLPAVEHSPLGCRDHAGCSAGCLLPTLGAGPARGIAPWRKDQLACPKGSPGPG